MSLKDLPDPTVPYQNMTRTMAQEISKPAHRLFIEERLRAIRDEHWWISNDQLYAEYREWCPRNGHQSNLSYNRFHGKMKDLEAGPLEDLVAQDDAEHEAPKKLSIVSRRLHNRRGYAPREAPIGAELVEQPVWHSLEDLMQR